MLNVVEESLLIAKKELDGDSCIENNQLADTSFATNSQTSLQITIAAKTLKRKHGFLSYFTSAFTILLVFKFYS